jgi:hypothetical protein
MDKEQILKAIIMPYKFIIYYINSAKRDGYRDESFHSIRLIMKKKRNFNILLSKNR